MKQDPSHGSGQRLRGSSGHQISPLAKGILEPSPRYQPQDVGSVIPHLCADTFGYAYDLLQGVRKQEYRGADDKQFRSCREFLGKLPESHQIDVPLGIVMQYPRERLGSEEIPWNDSLRTQEQSGSFAQDR